MEVWPVIGLYRKALSFQKPGAQPGLGTTENGSEDGISADERAQIAGHIDSMLSESRIQVTPQTLSYTPKRHGALLPIVSNVAIVAVFALAGFIMFRLLNHQEQYIASGQAAVQGAENQLIAAMKRQAREQLASRDQAILDAQSKLQSLSQQEAQMRSESDAAVKAREQQLAAQFDQKLAQEKDRLEKQGLSAAAQARQLQAYEAARRQETDRQLAAARQQAEADLAARQKSLAVLVSQTQDSLVAARQEREKIQSALDQPTAAQGTQAAAAGSTPGSAAAATPAAGTLPAGGSPDTTVASQDLARMRQQREKEQLVLDQILAGYSRVEASLESKNYAEAQRGLDSLRALVEDPSLASLPSIQKRSPVELFLINSLSDLVASRRSAAATAALPAASAGAAAPPPASADAAAASDAAAQLASISRLVAQGDGRMKAGDFAGARDAYLKAMGISPAVNQGYLGLEDVSAQLDRPGSPEAMNGLQQANLFFQAGSFRSSVEQYRAAVGLLLKDKQLANQLTDNIMNAGYHVLAADDLAALARFRTDAQRRAAAVQRLENLRSQYLAYAALSSSTPDTAGGESLATLLQAKIVLRQILDSDPIRSTYPNLGAQIEEYFVALEQQGKAEGRSAAISDMSAALGMKASGQPGKDPLAALLDGLESLLSDNTSPSVPVSSR